MESKILTFVIFYVNVFINSRRSILHKLCSVIRWVKILKCQQLISWKHGKMHGDQLFGWIAFSFTASEEFQPLKHHIFWKTQGGWKNTSSSSDCCVCTYLIMISVCSERGDYHGFLHGKLCSRLVDGALQSNSGKDWRWQVPVMPCHFDWQPVAVGQKKLSELMKDTLNFLCCSSLMTSMELIQR